ncbi:hypothetical protein U9M48_035811 [Paspalum notatum var. saurae]|uniref:Uncharacterized protein n=1 Tax=Paspalum notatum var. saurae TaxID=547442 RepID=A0AAQ3XAD8_PASNO
MLLPSPITAVFGRFVGHPQPPYGIVSLLPETSLSSARRHPFYVSNIPAILRAINLGNLSISNPCVRKFQVLIVLYSARAIGSIHRWATMLTFIRSLLRLSYPNQGSKDEALRLLGNQLVFCSNLI